MVSNIYKDLVYGVLDINIKSDHKSLKKNLIVIVERGYSYSQVILYYKRRPTRMKVGSSKYVINVSGNKNISVERNFGNRHNSFTKEASLKQKVD